MLARIVSELATRGHELHVVSSLPWYRRHAIEPGWRGRLVRGEVTAAGTITRVHPFPGTDKRDLVPAGGRLRRLLGGGGVGRIPRRRLVRRADAVIAMSPPLTLGITGRLVAWSHRSALVFNVQDIFPDAAGWRPARSPIGRVIAVAGWLERVSYRLADAVTVLSDDLRANVAAKLPLLATPRSTRSRTSWTPTGSSPPIA